MLLKKIKDKKATIGIIGLGYVGLPLAIEFCRTGTQVIGLDIDQEKIDLLYQGKSYIKHIPNEDINQLIQGKKFKGSVEHSLISQLDCILICVPTPLNKNREPDMSYVISTAQKISPYIVKNQLIVLESTTFPGTTQEVLIPELELESGLKANKDFYIAYSPEREDPNNKEYSIATTPKLIGSDHSTGLELADSMYSLIVNKTVLVSGTQVAEAAKLTENVFRAVNIALVNELKMIYEKMGIDIWEVIEACSTKPFGFMPFYPGPGLGGHCIPIDPFYLAWKAREHGITTRFIELAGEINTLMPDYVIQKIIFALNQQGKSLKNSRILLLGLAYKKNVDDTRESVTFKIMESLEEKGAMTDYNDPFIPKIKPTRKYKKFVGKRSVSLDKVNQYDSIVILTDHAVYDFETIVAQSKIIVDTRNACGNIKSNKIVKA